MSTSCCLSRTPTAAACCQHAHIFIRCLKGFDGRQLLGSVLVLPTSMSDVDDPLSGEPYALLPIRAIKRFKKIYLQPIGLKTFQTFFERFCIALGVFGSQKVYILMSQCDGNM